MKFLRNTLLLLVAVYSLSCVQTSQSKNIENIPLEHEWSEDFKSYWYQGEAELNRYELFQARYGEIRNGHAVMVFVTEDLLNYEQVKPNNSRGRKVIPVMKLNFLRKFNTGIYDYSMMSSIFSPVKKPKQTIKLTTSSQEWCGQTYLQVNLNEKSLQVLGHSYFENEGDQEYTIDQHMMEDGFWNLIRVDREALPIGDIALIPSATFCRLKHITFKAYNASCKLKDYEKDDLPGNDLQSFSVSYPELDRTLEIIFEKEFPHQIIGWKESFKSGFGPKAQIMETKGVLTHTRKSAYWNENKIKDEVIRNELGLN